jgi:predicted dehydrogenase
MSDLSRRQFLTVGGSAVLGSVAALGAQGANDRIRIGFIGCGGRGSVHLRNLVQMQGVEVRAICDIDPAAQQRSVKILSDAGHSEPKLYPKLGSWAKTLDNGDRGQLLNPQAAWWQQMLEQESLDAIVSALPCDLHRNCYVDVLNAGLDLYGEKPMCITVEGCNAIMDAAKRSNAVLQIGYQRRSDPRYVQPMKQVRQGKLGDMIEGRIVWSNAWGPLWGWKSYRERSGDWMLEQAVHNWDVINWATGQVPKRAWGIGRSDLFRDRLPDRNVTDYYTATVEYPNGLIVSIWHSWVAGSAFNTNYTRLCGTAASLDCKTGRFTYLNKLDQGNEKGWSYDGTIHQDVMHMRNFLDCVRSRNTPNATPEMGRDGVLAGLLVRDAVYRNEVSTMDKIRSEGAAL